LAEESMFADLWEKDRVSKCKREEMEAVMQLERNREMLRVSNSILSHTKNYHTNAGIEPTNSSTGKAERRNKTIA